MAQLYGRYCTITVGNLRITGLRMAFKVFKSLDPEPNTTEISIYNLNSDHRAALNNVAVPVIVDAGYDAQHEMIFQGKLRKGISTRQGSDWVTTLKAGDGELTYRSARINEPLSPGTAIAEAAKRLARAMGVGLGDAEAKITSAIQRTGITQFVNGAVLSGSVKDRLTEQLKGLGLSWSIQDEVLQVLDGQETAPNGTTSDTAVHLSAQTGLVGSQSAGTLGVIKVTSLMQPGIRPGRKVLLDGVSLQGLYRVEKVTHNGDTHGQPWYSEAEVKPL